MKCDVCKKYVHRQLVRCINCGYKMKAIQTYKTILNPKSLATAPVLEDTEINRQLNKIYHIDESKGLKGEAWFKGV